MAHIRVTIDGRTIMDGDPTYIGKPPPELTPDNLRAGGVNAEPWKLALLPTFASAAMSGQAVNIDITTSGKDFTMSVNYPG